MAVTELYRYCVRVGGMMIHWWNSNVLNLKENTSSIIFIENSESIHDFEYLPYDITEEQIKLYLTFQ